MVQATAVPSIDLPLTQPTSPDELLDLVLELNAFFSIVVVVMMVEIVFARITLVRMSAHPFRLW